MTTPDKYAASVGGFEWGHNDCIMFAHGWYRCVTGEDHPALPVKPYDTELGAARALRGVFIQHGVSNVPDLFDKLFDRCAPTEGALAVIETGRKGIVSSHLTGVCNSRWTMLSVSKEGPVMISAENAMCWEVK